MFLPPSSSPDGFFQSELDFFLFQNRIQFLQSLFQLPLLLFGGKFRFWTTSFCCFSSTKRKAPEMFRFHLLVKKPYFVFQLKDFLAYLKPVNIYPNVVPLGRSETEVTQLWANLDSRTRLEHDLLERTGFVLFSRLSLMCRSRSDPSAFVYKPLGVLKRGAVRRPVGGKTNRPEHRTPEESLCPPGETERFSSAVQTLRATTSFLKVWTWNRSGSGRRWTRRRRKVSLSDFSLFVWNEAAQRLDRTSALTRICFNILIKSRVSEFRRSNLRKPQTASP